MFDDFANKDFRDAFLAENIRARLAFQIRALREKKKWSQPQLAKRAGKTQSVISRLEDPNYGKYTIKTLLDMASAFDVALLISFVPYTKLITEISDVSPRALAVASYEEEKAEMEKTVTAISAGAAVVSPQEQGRHAFDAGRPQTKSAASLGYSERTLIQSSSLLGRSQSPQLSVEIRP